MGSETLLLPVTYFPTNLVYPLTLRVTGIITILVLAKRLQSFYKTHSYDMYTSHNFFQKDRFPLSNFVTSRVSVNRNKKLTTNTEIFVKGKLKSEYTQRTFHPSQGHLHIWIWMRMSFKLWNQFADPITRFFKKFSLVYLKILNAQGAQMRVGL